MTSAAGVRYVIRKLRLSRFQQCTVRRLPSRKSSSTLQSQANVQYQFVAHKIAIWYYTPMAGARRGAGARGARDGRRAAYRGREGDGGSRGRGLLNPC